MSFFESWPNLATWRFSPRDLPPASLLLVLLFLSRSPVLPPVSRVLCAFLLLHAYRHSPTLLHARAHSTLPPLRHARTRAFLPPPRAHILISSYSTHAHTLLSLVSGFNARPTVVQTGPFGYLSVGSITCPIRKPETPQYLPNTFAIT